MTPDVRQKLDRMTNILFAGGVANPITYVEQLSYLIYLKLLDEAEADREVQARLGVETRPSMFPAQAKRFRWSEWRFLSGQKLVDFVGDEVFPYLASLVREAPQVALYFQDARLEATDPHVLKEVIDIIDTLHFAKLGPDVKGDIFEYQLLKLQKTAKSDLGQFRTPRHIRKFMVEMVDPDLGDSVFDPACGTAGFLVDALEHILVKYSDPEHIREIPIYGEGWLEEQGFADLEAAREKFRRLQTYRKGVGERLHDWRLMESSFYGFDVSRQMVRIAMMNLVLHSIPGAKIKRGNTLSETGGLSEDDLARRYKVILSNPPFAGLLPRDSIRSDLPTNAKKSELLFLAMMMDALAPGGRCAVVVPEGLLFGNTAGHTDIRRRLVEDFQVLAIISLPAGVFKPYAGVKTSVIVFRRAAGESRTRTERVWFYEIKSDGYDPDRISGGGRIETPDVNQIPDMLAQWAEFRKSNFQNPPGIESGSIIPNSSPDPSCWWAELESIRGAEFNLTAAAHKPTRTAIRDDLLPSDLLNAVMHTERSILKDLEELTSTLDE